VIMAKEESILKKYLNDLNLEHERVLAQFEAAINTAPETPENLQIAKFHMERFKIYAKQIAQIAVALEAKYKEVFAKFPPEKES